MKKIKHISSLLLIIVTLCSCSQRRYSYLTKIRCNDENISKTKQNIHLIQNIKPRGNSNEDFEGFSNNHPVNSLSQKFQSLPKKASLTGTKEKRLHLSPIKLTQTSSLKIEMKKATGKSYLVGKSIRPKSYLETQGPLIALFGLVLWLLELAGALSAGSGLVGLGLPLLGLGLLMILSGFLLRLVGWL